MEGASSNGQSIEARILATIHGRGEDSVFVPSDFLEIGGREAVDVALHQLIRQGAIRRLAQGVYDYPRQHPVMGVWPRLLKWWRALWPVVTELGFSQRGPTPRICLG